MAILSQTADYALRAVLYVAEQAEDEPVQVAKMAEALRIPQNYLSKILHQLARTGVLSSTRGKAGGFQLAVPADRLRLITVIAPFDRFEQRRQCLLGRPECSDRTACAAHGRWKHVADTLVAFFRETSVADLVRGTAVATP